MAEEKIEKKKSGKGKFFLGAALGAIAGVFAGRAISKKCHECEDEDECGDECECGDKCECKKEEKAEKTEEKTAKEAKKK